MRSHLAKLRSRIHLAYAWKKLKKSNKQSHGLDDVTIEDFKLNLDTELDIISRQLRQNTYRFSRMRGVTIPKSGSDKPRPIQVPAVRDRVVMKALALLVEPKLSRYDLPCSFAYITGSDRGVHGAIREIRALAEKGYDVVVEADISNFFGEVDQERLFKKLFGIVKSPSL